MNNKEITLLTTSCKAYEDVLEIHEKLYSLYWDACPFSRILVMDLISKDAPYIKKYNKVIETGKESGKANHKRINMALEEINTPYVVFVQEDMLLDAIVNADLWIKLLSVMKEKKAGVLYLNGQVGENKYVKEIREYEDIMEYPKGMPYRISYAPAIWDKDYLVGISNRYDFGADFERLGSRFSDGLDRCILGYKFNAYPYINAIRRGKWERIAVQLLLNYRIIPDLSKHPVMNAKDELKQSIINYVYNINPSKVLNLQRLFHLGKTY